MVCPNKYFKKKKRKGRVMGMMGQTSRWDRVGDRRRQTRTDMNTHKQGQPGSGATTHREKTSYPDEEGERRPRNIQREKEGLPWWAGG